jgi:predicted enzyme related to lactoylglutathione lyase
MIVAASRLRDICFDCADPRRVAGFWAEVLGYTLHPADPGDIDEESVPIEPPPGEGGGLRIWFNKVPEPKVVKNRVHIDINMPDDAEMQRLQALGARPLQEIRGDDGTLWWTIMADPEGNEFCAFPPRR